MKELTILVQEHCRYCTEALNTIAGLKREHPELAEVPLRLIDEERHPEETKPYHYWYVPTYSLGRQKLFEGAVDRYVMELILRAALEADA